MLAAVIDEFLCLVESAAHTFRSGGEHKVRAHRTQQSPAFQRHRFRHGQRQLVTARGSDEGQRDTGIAAGRLDDLDALLEHTTLLRIPDHRRPDAAFDRVRRIAAFNFRQDR